ncbi:CD3324 family protein [Paenibacillus lemnae]|uniref:CD3324 family protein n=1 Tax=Paenibacillus lemnae TaxID=1330551 RepID=UPI001B7D5FD3|nr:CD3324 family protein [Paenibacillus lemnae]
MELLKQVQKYAAGKLLYIPSGEEKRAWGETTGYREQLQKRNQMIRNKYAHGLTVSELADEYCLSLDSIKKILYSKNRDKNLNYVPTLESAVRYANAGMLEEWAQSYLLLTQQALLAAEHVIQENALYFGVIKFPLRLIQFETQTQDTVGLKDDHDELRGNAEYKRFMKYYGNVFIYIKNV